MCSNDGGCSSKLRVFQIIIIVIYSILSIVLSVQAYSKLSEIVE